MVAMREALSVEKHSLKFAIFFYKITLNLLKQIGILTGRYLNRTYKLFNSASSYLLAYFQKAPLALEKAITTPLQPSKMESLKIKV